MEAGDDLLRQQHLDVARVAALGHLAPEAGDLVVAAEGQQLVVAPHQIVGDRHQLAEDLGRRLGDADVIAERLGHLVHAVEALQQRHHQHALRRLAVVLLQLAPHQQVELLVGAAEFDIGLHGHGIVALAQRVEEFVDGDRLAAGVALGEVVALEHARDGVARGELDHAGGADRLEPGGVEADLGLLRVEDLEHLGTVGVGVLQDLLARKRRAGRVLAAGVADHAGEVADQEHDVVAEVLEVAQLVDQHGVAEVQVGRGRVEAGLDAQRAAGFEFFDQFGLDQQFVGAALDQRQLGVDLGHD